MSRFVPYFKNHKKAFISLGALVLSLALWFAIWWIAAMKIGISFILPSPAVAFREFFRLIPQKVFILAVTGSLVRVISGFSLGISLGAAVAIFAHALKPLKFFFAPFVKMVRATPVASFILICVLWMPTDAVPIFIAFLMVFPIVYENVLTGLSHTDIKLIEVTKIYGYSRLQALRQLYLPYAMPYFVSSANASLGLAWKSCVSAEVLAVCAKSVGYYIYVSKQYFETEQLFAWTISIILLSIILEYAVKGIAHLISRYTKNRFGGTANGI